MRLGSNRFLLAVVAIAAVGAAIAANWALLVWAQSGDNRIGRLSPKATIVSPVAPTPPSSPRPPRGGAADD